MLKNLFRSIKVGLVLGSIVGLLSLYVMFHDEEDKIDPIVEAQLFESIADAGDISSNKPVQLAKTEVFETRKTDPLLTDDADLQLEDTFSTEEELEEALWLNLQTVQKSQNNPEQG